MRVLITKTIQEHLRRAIWFIILVCIRDEQQLWSSSNPNPSKANLDPTDKIQSLGKYLAIFKRTIPIKIF
jgi:hypothetical protein